MLDKPAADPEEAKWLKVPDAALLLEAARLVPDLPSFAYPLLATFLLTGGRRAEVLGLEVEDLTFDRHTITFRKNHSRAAQEPHLSAGCPDVAAVRGDFSGPTCSTLIGARRLLFPRFTPIGEGC